MGGSHTHVRHARGGAGQDGGERSAPVPASVRVVLLVAVGLIAAGTVAGLAAFWPRGGLPSGTRQAGTYPGGTVEQAEVSSVRAYSCPGTSDDRLPDGTIPATATCVAVRARVLGGPGLGQTVSVQVAPQVYRAGIGPGDRIQVVRYPQGSGQGDAYAWVDFSRGMPLGLLAGLFAVLVVAVARLRGLAALAGLALGFLTVLKFMLPALLRGENGIGVALTGSVAIMIVLLYVAHGVSAKTTTALLGTVAGLAVTAGLAAWSAGAAHLNGLTSEDTYTLSMLTGNGGLSGVVLCGIIVAGLGVLNDVTVTQASAVWELHEHAPQLGRRGLFAAGMRIGRDHLASTVYTIAFAYAGVALPTLLLIDLYRQPLGQVISGGQMAEEIVRALVGAIGLVLAIPLTTAVAALVVCGARRAAPSAGATSSAPFPGGWITAGADPDAVPPGLGASPAAGVDAGQWWGPAGAAGGTPEPAPVGPGGAQSG